MQRAVESLATGSAGSGVTAARRERSAPARVGLRGRPTQTAARPTTRGPRRCPSCLTGSQQRAKLVGTVRLPLVRSPSFSDQTRLPTASRAIDCLADSRSTKILLRSLRRFVAVHDVGLIVRHLPITPAIGSSCDRYEH